MRRIRNILIVFLAVAILCGSAVLPRIVAEIQDGALLNVLSYGQMNPVKLELSQEEAQTGSGLGIMEKLAIYRNGSSFYPGEEYATIHTREEIMAVGQQVADTYRDAGLIREPLEPVADECMAVVAFSTRTPNKLFTVWYLCMANYDAGAYLGMGIDDETGQVLMVNYESYDTEMEWDRVQMCDTLYSLFTKSLDSDALSAIEPYAEERDDGYEYTYDTQYISWGDTNYGEVVLCFTVSNTGFCVSFY